jgi:hypothetical protein
VGSNLIELTPELFDQDLGIDSILKPLHRETSIAKFAVEGFIGSVLPRFSRIDACVLMFDSFSQRNTAREINSEPLSDRKYVGAP